MVHPKDALDASRCISSLRRPSASLSMAMKKYPLVAKSRYPVLPDKSIHPVFVVSIRNCGPRW